MGPGQPISALRLPVPSGPPPCPLPGPCLLSPLVSAGRRSDAIYSALYDGTGHIEVLRGHEYLSHPFAVTLYGGEVYWTDWRTNTLAKANKWTGHNVTVVQRTNTQPFDLQVYHPSRQPLGKAWGRGGGGMGRGMHGGEVAQALSVPGTGMLLSLIPFAAPNPCEANGGKGPCSHLCLINYNRTLSCACPHLMKLDKDNTTCYGRGCQPTLRRRHRLCRPGCGPSAAPLVLPRV